MTDCKHVWYYSHMDVAMGRIYSVYRCKACGRKQAVPRIGGMKAEQP